MIRVTAHLTPHTIFSVYAEGPDAGFPYTLRAQPTWPDAKPIMPHGSPHHVRYLIAPRWILNPTGDNTSTPLFLNSAVYFSDIRGFDVDIPALCALYDPSDIIVHHNQRYFVIPGWRFEDQQVHESADNDNDNRDLPTITSADFCLPVRNFITPDLPSKLALTRFLPLRVARWVVQKHYRYVTPSLPPVHCDKGVAFQSVGQLSYTKYD